MTEWAEIRHQHVVEGVPKRELARRFGRDVKTVRRALTQSEAPQSRRTPPRGQLLDGHREQIESWLAAEPRISAKRIGVLLSREGVVAGERTVRKYVAGLRGRRREAFVHRTARPGDALEIDFGESRAVVAGRDQRVQVFVATLPASNVYFAKAYPCQRLECWLDGIESACRWLGGLPERLVLDNTSVAVKEVLVGRERVEHRAFAAWRGELALGADFCAPAKGWEKGSVEAGVRYVRANCLRPLQHVADIAELNARILEELEEDLVRRHLPDGRTAAAALEEERTLLRGLPRHWPEACRVETRKVNRFGHVRVDQATYSVPIEHAYRSAVVKLYPGRVDVALGAQVVASHERSYARGAHVLDPLHVLDLLAHKSRAAGEATALGGGRVPEALLRLRRELHTRVRARHADREWTETLLLVKSHGWSEVVAATELALEQGSPRRATIVRLLRSVAAEEAPAVTVPVGDATLAAIEVAAPDLTAYDVLGRATRGVVGGVPGEVAA
jgi:transposase